MVLLPLLVAVVSLAACDTPATRDFADGQIYASKPDRLVVVSHWEDKPGNKLGASPRLALVGDYGGGKDDMALFYEDPLKLVQVGRYDRQGKLAWPAAPVPLAGQIDDDEIGAGDVDGDGLTDLVVGNSTQRTLTVYLSRKGAGGAALVKTDTAHVYGCVKIASLVRMGSFIGLADVDADGKDDLIFRCSAPESIEVQLAGGKVVRSEVTFPASGSVSRWAVADLDGDKKRDMAVSSYLGSRVAVYFGDGAGAFSAGVTRSLPGEIVSLSAAGVFDSDGGAAHLLYDAREVLEKKQGSVVVGRQRYGVMALAPASRALREVGPLESTNLVPLLPATPARAQSSHETGRIYGSVFQVAGDLTGDGVDDVVQLGYDADFGYTGPWFIRVLVGGPGGLRYASNTRVESSFGRPRRCEVDPDSEACRTFTIIPVVGRFLGNGKEQLLVLDQLYRGWWMYEFR